MLQVTAIVKGNPRQVQTKHGERSVVDVLLPDGTVSPIWAPAGYMPILGRRNGERITVAQESNGKLHILETMSDGLASPNTTNQPLPTSTSAVATAVMTKTSAPAVATKPTPDQAIDVMIKRYASIMSKCRQQIISQMDLVNEETIQKYAVSLFIQTLKTLEQF